MMHGACSHPPGSYREQVGLRRLLPFSIAFVFLFRIIALFFITRLVCKPILFVARKLLFRRGAAEVLDVPTPAVGLALEVFDRYTQPACHLLAHASGGTFGGSHLLRARGVVGVLMMKRPPLQYNAVFRCVSREFRGRAIMGAERESCRCVSNVIG